MQLHAAAVGGGAREFEAALASSSLVGVVVVTRGVRSSKSCMSDARPSRVAPTLLPATAPIFGEKKIIIGGCVFGTARHSALPIHLFRELANFGHRQGRNWGVGGNCSLLERILPVRSPEQSLWEYFRDYGFVVEFSWFSLLANKMHFP